MPTYLDENKFTERYTQFFQYKKKSAELIELLETRTRKFRPPFDGYYYPLQFSDTYSLLVNYSGKFNAEGEPDDEGKSLNNQPFLNLKQEVNQRIDQQVGTIGQTWLLWGNLTSQKTDTEITEIAQRCYTQFVIDYDWKRDLIGQGQLLGGTIFELWYCPQSLDVNGQEFWDKFREKNHHLLIWLFPDNVSADAMRNQVKSSYQDFIRLWQYRHKIVWSYYQSRYQKSLLKQEYVEIQPAIKQASELPISLKNNKLKLNQLQTILSDNLINLSDYTIALNYLENHHQTIKINLDNYQSRLTEMEIKYPDSNLEFLKKFSEGDIYAQKYQRQIQADSITFQPGLTLLQNLNSTIEGIITLEQTKSDRQLNNTIAIAGVGLATSSLGSAVILAQPTNYKQDIGFRVEVFLWSLGIGAIAIFLTMIIIRIYRHFRS
ncbi:hypothetical protein [Calothrix rhizosoleniae]|uniref:hypothetical protein n=1 Tax=Calothrix rhizosoleniae TaxID=888997 RepID=UPI000B4A1E5A|nr:hypothetical protein [Calothrix rhizosoleniae]